MTALSGVPALRPVRPGSIPRDCRLTAAADIGTGWGLLIAGLWYRVVGDPEQISAAATDGGRVKLWIQGPGIEIVDVTVLPRLRRFWARKPASLAAEALLGEAAGPGVDGDERAPGGAP